MALKVTVVGSQDRELETVLRACGTAPTVVPMHDLAGLAHASTKQPDLVVIDLRATGVVPPGLSALRRQHGGTGVIIVARTLDPELILSAMRAGANECVAEPLSQAELDAAITRIVARQSAPAASQSFAFVGVKGGVGTTVLAVNVATALARVATAGTVLVDLHVTRGETALYLGLEPRFTVLEALENIHKLDDAFFRSLVVRASSHLDVLAAPADGAATNRLDPGRVRTLLEFTSKHFEFTVVDVPRTDGGALDALEGMKTIVVVTTQELPAVRGATVLANRLRQRYGKERVMVVMNRHDDAADIRHADVEQVLGAPVAHMFPSDYRVTLDSVNRGRPIVLGNHSSLAASFEKFARTLAGLKKEEPQLQTSSGWFGRLTGRK